MATLTGTSIPADITASGTGGELTFHFTSNGSNTSAGWEATISCVTSVLAPDKPDPVTFGAVTSSTAEVNWTAPDDNGSTITAYSLEQKEGIAGVFGEIYSGTNLTFTATGLTAWTTYYFRVKATNSGGDSPYSDESPVIAGQVVMSTTPITTFGAIFLDPGGAIFSSPINSFLQIHLDIS